LVLATALAPACANGGDEMASEARLEGSEWRLVWLDTGAIQAADPTRAPTLKLEAPGARAFGYGGCNRFSGGYTLAGDALQFTPLAATKMACEDMATESSYFAALEQTRAWRLAHGRLELRDGHGNTVAAFEATPAP
jgi:heat shock protein HslJ